jgi:hypothetical protein
VRGAHLRTSAPTGKFPLPPAERPARARHGAVDQDGKLSHQTLSCSAARHLALDTRVV